MRAYGVNRMCFANTRYSGDNNTTVYRYSSIIIEIPYPPQYLRVILVITTQIIYHFGIPRVGSATAATAATATRSAILVDLRHTLVREYVSLYFNTLHYVIKYISFQLPILIDTIKLLGMAKIKSAVK